VDERLERVEAEAFASLAESVGLPLLRIAGAICTAAPVAPTLPLLNRVGGIADATDDELAEIDAFYREHAIPHYVVATVAPELAERLVARGFEQRRRWMKFGREPKTPHPAATSLRIGDASGGDVAAIVGTVFGVRELAAMLETLPGRDGWHWFAAYEGEEPVACGALFVHDGAGWLGVGGTLPEHRGKGAQSAILAARIVRARELGVDLLATETGERTDDGSNTSYDNILRAGFAEAYLRPNLVSP
jgi:hypothetical protein